MISDLYWIAAAGALIGGLAGDRLAWPLLASAAFCVVARWQEVPFNINLWLTVDALVVMGVGTVLLNEASKGDWQLTARHGAILALFVPMMAAYFMEASWGHFVSSVAGAAQMVLVFPGAKLLRVISNFVARVKESARAVDEMIRALMGGRRASLQ